MVGTAPDPADIVAYYELEDLTDSTGNGYTLTNSGATSGATGIVDDGFSLDGNDSLSINNVAVLNNVFGILMWYNPVSSTPTTSERILDTFGGGGNVRITHNNTSGTVTFRGYDGGLVEFTTPSALSVGFHQMGILFDTSNIYFVLDGVVVDTQAFGTVDWTSSTGFVFGADKGLAGAFCDGVFDEMLITNVLFSSDNLLYLYNGGIPGSGQQYPFVPPIPPSLTGKPVGGGKMVQSWLSLMSFMKLISGQIVEFSNRQLADWGFLSPHQQIAGDFGALVVKVHDADTVTVKADFRSFTFPIRIANIDAPELNEPDGEEAATWLRSRLLGKEVVVKVNNKNRVGKYGRLIGEIYQGGFNVGEEMLMSGLVAKFGMKDIFEVPPISKFFSGVQV